MADNEPKPSASDETDSVADLLFTPPEVLNPDLHKPHQRRVLLLSSYCCDDESDCSDETPCDDCLRMCNVAEVMVGLDDVIGEFGSENLKPKTEADADQQLQNVVFRPHWPEGLDPEKMYQFNCDDEGRDGTTFFRVIVANDGDVHLCASSMLDPGAVDPVTGETHPPIFENFPSARCRTGIGGGRHRRTRQALLWLARAIQLDNEELGIENS